MKQSPLTSLLDSLGGTAVGFALAIIAQAVFWPLLGFEISSTQNFVSVAIMTVISVGRGFVWRRCMEALFIRHPISPFMMAAMAERRRQKDDEGWHEEHDDAHSHGELEQAAAAYLLAGKFVYRDPETGKEQVLDGEGVWPWDKEWWKPRERRRNLVRACALTVAAGEKFDRWRKVKRTPAQQTIVKSLAPRRGDP